jgi:ribosomal protein S18 acetylase RimI-like enzyme
LSSTPHLEILDLRHFSAAQLQPLLRDESERWQRRLHWDYTRSAHMLLEYLDARILPGFVALRAGAIVGYAFCVFEAAKAVIGDVYVFGETERLDNPVCETLLDHLLEMLRHTPGVDRIESQLLMFPAGALHRPFVEAGFRLSPRLFMIAPLPVMLAQAAQEHGLQLAPLPDHLLLHPWQPENYEAAAALIHRCYASHMDAGINDQYRTVHGAQRFLHNIIRFPGCGVFSAEHSQVLRNRHTGALLGVVLCSRIRGDVGHITQLCLDPSGRGLGLGRRLLEQCALSCGERGITHLSLTVTEANTPARTLYEHLGFQTLHRFEAMVWERAASSV